MQPTALVIGDIALDRRTEGTAVAVSREAPVPTIRQTKVIDSLGWAGNVAANIVALGHPVLLMGTIGDASTQNNKDTDEAGHRVIELAHGLGIQTNFQQVLGKPTVVKHRTTCDGQIIGRVDVQQYPMACDSGLIQGLQALNSYGQFIKVIVISDNGNGTITPDLMTAVRSFAQTFSIPIFVDCRPRHDALKLYRGVSLLKPNCPDAIKLLDISNNVHPGLSVLADPLTQQGVACQQLRRDYDAGLVVVTNGRHGCSYTDTSSEVEKDAVRDYDAIGLSDVDTAKDICGAGDTVMAALAVGLMEGMEWSRSVLFAMQCAGYVVQFFGVKTADRDQVEEFIDKLTNWTRKLMDDESVVKFIERKRRLPGPNRIVLANGCFDGFHGGHLETLRFAKREGEVLIVAYNDDESLRSLKGTNRPHVPDSYRSSHLAAQEPVDAVIRFDGDVEKLVRLIQPDVLVKGADAQRQYAQLPGADYVASRGGKVSYCPTDQFYITIDRQTAGNTTE